MSASRNPDYPIERLFLDRWSPRAFDQAPISDEELMRLFEAARWAPSSYNEQPWRFLYARRDGEHWDDYLRILVEFNRQWARHASVLIALVSVRNFVKNGRPNRCHSFDCGAAWQNLALQASLSGLAAHAMAGFDPQEAVRRLAIPQDCEVQCMIAVGRMGSAEQLPPPLREREVLSGRRTTSEFVIEGGWKTE